MTKTFLAIALAASLTPLMTFAQSTQTQTPPSDQSQPKTKKGKKGKKAKKNTNSQGSTSNPSK